ncbi:MAG TPA: A/G-specific adenine glycosylase [Methylomirabilota bacterium]|nr:A/G-specific adenine glycosylase [Methylomirabilota bacterium]
MLKKRELALLQKRLLEWFRQFQRDLPWRRTKDPYRIWLSEIMLQQTRVAAVIPYYERFLQRFPHIQVLAAAPEREVLRLWSGLGYYGRARNLHRAAHQIVTQHGGTFPESYEEILKLSGIGNYSAAAISSIAFGEKQAVLDGNVARVLARLGAIRGDLRAPGRWQELQKMASEYLVKNLPGEWNQAMMELGATLCTPKSPQCLLCPVNEFCEGRKLGIAESLPESRKKRATVEVTLAAAVFADKNGWTLLLPPPKGTNESRLADYVPVLVSNLWHFPTVSVNGNAAANLRAHLRKLHLHAANQKLRLTPAEEVRHSVTYRAITVRPFHIPVRNLPHIQGAERVPLHDISAFPVSNLTRKVARAALASATRHTEKRKQ